MKHGNLATGIRAAALAIAIGMMGCGSGKEEPDANTAKSSSIVGPAVESVDGRALDGSDQSDALVDGPIIILSIPIGVDAPIKQCSGEWREEADVFDYHGVQSVLPCYEYSIPREMAFNQRHFFKNIPADGALVRFVVDEDKIPEGFFEGPSTITGLFIDGRNQEIILSTHGLSVRDIVLDQLKTKFGTPTEYVEEDFETRIGQVYDNVWVTWVFQNYSVYFLAIEDTLDEGTVIVRTKKAQAFADREDAKKPKL